MQSMKKLLEDERIPSVICHVSLHEGSATHYYITEEGYVVVTVKTNTHGVPIDAIMMGGDDAGYGLWQIPSIGTEVTVTFDNGDFEGDAYITNVHGTKPPSGLTPGHAQMVGPRLTVHNGGTPYSVIRTSDLDPIIQYIKNQMDPATGHVHATLGAPPTESVVPGTSSCPDAPGSDVLHSE